MFSVVKLQKRFAYKYKNKMHHKYQITIPDALVERLRWKEGRELHLTIENEKLIVDTNTNDK